MDAASLRFAAEARVEDALGIQPGSIAANEKLCSSRDECESVAALMMAGWMDAVVEDEMIRLMTEDT